jgi:hypothetical protein
MTPTEIVESALTYNLSSVALSLAAVYAILGDKFIRPTVDRGETILAKLRGDISTHIADAVRPFTVVENTTVARVAFVGVRGETLEQAHISRAPSVESEAFREAVRECVDGKSPAFDNYWCALAICRRMKVLFRVIRFVLCGWPLVSVGGVAFLELIKNGIVDLPSEKTLWVFSILTIVPLFVFIFAMPLMSYYASSIERLER